MTEWMQRYRETCDKIWNIGCKIYNYIEESYDFCLRMHHKTKDILNMFNICVDISIKSEFYECFRNRNIVAVHFDYDYYYSRYINIIAMFMSNLYNNVVDNIVCPSITSSGEIYVYDHRIGQAYYYDILYNPFLPTEEKLMYPENYACLYANILPKISTEARMYLLSAMMPSIEYIRIRREEIEKTINSIEPKIAKEINEVTIDIIVPPTYPLHAITGSYPLPFQLVFGCDGLKYARIYDKSMDMFDEFDVGRVEKDRIVFLEEDGEEKIKLVAVDGMTIGEALEKAFVPTLEKYARAVMFFATESDMRDKIEEMWHIAMTNFLRYI